MIPETQKTCFMQFCNRHTSPCISFEIDGINIYRVSEKKNTAVTLRVVV